MNKLWSELFKNMQVKLKKKETFDSGIDDLIELRNQLKDSILEIFNKLSPGCYSMMPLKSDKTIAYYTWHMTRIEDITSNLLMNEKEQVYEVQPFDQLIQSPIHTTGNELKREELVEFSKSLDIHQLLKYYVEVQENTNNIIRSLKYSDLKTKVTEDKKEYLLSKKVVSIDKDAFWLVDYWCNKSFFGLLLMPISRHLIMHTEGCVRIYNKLKKKIVD